MQSTPQTASTSVPTPVRGSAQSRIGEDVTYQAVTIGAVLLLLVSLWVF
jgi:hypothetical protein